MDEGLSGGATTWQQVPDFYGASGDDMVYTLDETTGTITFGDNHYGAIPLPNPSNPTNITATAYRYGGGAAGNVAIGTITSLQSYVAYVASVTNPVTAGGGADEETQADAVMRAGSDIRSTNRAVTADDFETLALETPGALVARATALPLTNPAFLGIEVPGSVTVIVVPHRQVDDDPSLQTTQTGPPIPNQTTLQAVCAWLDQHRLVTTELHVVGPAYRTLTFDISVYCAADADLGQISQRIQTALRALYAPAGNGGGWSWGAPAYAAIAFATIMNVAGVTRVSAFSMTLDGVAIPVLGDAVIGPKRQVVLGPGSRRRQRLPRCTIHRPSQYLRTRRPRRLARGIRDQPSGGAFPADAGRGRRRRIYLGGVRRREQRLPLGPHPAGERSCQRVGR